MADSRFFQKSGQYNLAQLAAHVGGQLDPKHHDKIIQDVAALHTAQPHEISFFDNIKYKDKLQETKAGACVITAEMAAFLPQDCVGLIVPSSYKAYAQIASLFYPEHIANGQISDHAIIADDVVIGQGVQIDAGAIIGSGAQIGDGCWIESGAVIGQNVVLGAACRVGVNASLSHAIIGDHVHIYTGARIGQDGFGFAIDPRGHVKVPQLGRVLVGHGVHIGANTTIDRGASSDTIIGDGTWIDNLVQIGHNVKTGRGCVIVAQVGISGSTELGDFVVLAGQVGVAGHLKIGTGARVAAQSGLMRDVAAGDEIMGSPAVPIKQFMRQTAYVQKAIKPKKKENENGTH